jgi:hypothetical protein
MKLPQNYNKLSPAERRTVRLEYVNKQNGLCHHCKKPLCENPSSEVMDKRIKKELFPENFFKYPVHLHHCHKTGFTIGAVHSRCNAVLWQYHGE